MTITVDLGRKTTKTVTVNWLLYFHCFPVLVCVRLLISLCSSISFEQCNVLVQMYVLCEFVVISVISQLADQKKAGCLTLEPVHERGTCMKRLFWPPYEVKKNKSCSSQVSLYYFIRTIAKV